MSTSRFVFMTPTRLSDQEHPHIRAFVHNLRTGVGSKIQAIKTCNLSVHRRWPKINKVLVTD